MTVRIERFDRTRLIGQRVSDSRSLLPTDIRAASMTNSRATYRVVHMVGTVLSLVTSAACQRHAVPQAVVPVPSSKAVEQVPPDPTPLQIPATSAERYVVDVHLHTIELGSTPALQDSMSWREWISTRLVVADSSTKRLVLMRDSLALGPSQQRSRTNFSRDTLTNTITFRRVGDSVLYELPVERSCQTRQSLIYSHLFLRVFLSTVLASNQPQRFTYSSCHLSIPIHSSVDLASDTTPTTAQTLTRTILLTGKVIGDSTNQFPMYLSGAISGNATAARQSRAAVWPTVLKMLLSVDLIASNSLKQQRFQQQLQILLQAQ